MRYDRARIKDSAKELLRRTQPKPWTVTFFFWFLALDIAALCLLVLLAAGWFSLPEGESLSTFSLILTLPVVILTALFLILLHAGYRAYCFRLRRTGKAGPIDLIQGFLFSSPVLSLYGLSLLLAALWAAPGVAVVRLIRYLASLTGLEPLYITVTVIGWTCFGVYFLNRVLRYSFAFCALMEQPQRTAWDAIQKSMRIMRGRKLAYFIFRLSFLGWALLAAGTAALPILPALLVQATAEQLPFLGGAALPEWFLIPFVIVGVAAAAPLLLWLHAYQGTAAVGFYQAACAPPFPGVTPAQPALGGKRLIR